MISRSDDSGAQTVRQLDSCNVTFAASLTARTEPFDGDAPLKYASPESPTVFLRGDEGIVGVGETLRLTFSGEHRFAEAADAWAAIVEAATVHDALRLPGTGLVAFGSFAFDATSRSESVLIIPQIVLGEAEGKRWVTRITLDIEDSSSPVDELLRPSEIEETRVELRGGRISRAAYEGEVVAALEHIGHGDVSKLVVARDLEGQLPESADVRSVVRELRRRYPSAMTYSVDGTLGASPETLVRARGGQFWMRVLAGTTPRGATTALDTRAAHELANSEKNVEEHRVAVESALASLRELGMDATPGEMFTLQLPNLWHLATDIEGSLEGRSTLRMLETIHPTAAVGGTPTEKAMELIRKVEGIDRGRYAAPVGWTDSQGNATWAIALRGAEIATSGLIRAFAGAGIVADSDSRAELRETDIKFRPIRDAFADPLPPENWG